MEDWDELLAKYFAGEANTSEQQKAEEWIKKHPEEANILREAWEVNLAPKFAPNVAVAWNKVQNEIRTNEHKPSQPAKQRKLNLGWAAAAMLVLALGVTWWLYSGKKSDNEWLTKQVASKQTSPIALADGSKVWLNKNSELRYPKKFANNQREVYLKGEAFFEVSPQPDKAFKVHTANTTTQVLGTSFSVKSHANETSIAVMVASGKVAFFANDTPNKKLILNKNQQGIFDKKTQDLAKQAAYDPNLLAWKTGVLSFAQTSLAEVAQALADYYEVNINIGNEALKTCVLTTTLERLPLKDAVEVVALTLGIEYTIKANQVTFKGKACK